MIEHLINYAASLFNVPGWGGLDVKGFANLMLVLFGTCYCRRDTDGHL